MSAAPPPIQDARIECVSCGYNLTGVTIGSVCPECGTPVDESILRRRETERTCGAATASMVLGILSLAVCAPLGIVALILYGIAIREIDRGGYSKSARTFAKAGLIMGIIGTILSFIWVPVMLLEVADW